MWKYETHSEGDPNSLARQWLAFSMTYRAPATVRRRKASVTEYLKWMGEDDVLKFRLPGAPAPDPHPLPSGMFGVNAMVAAAPTLDQRLLVWLCGRLGLRVSEAVDVRPPDYDPVKRALRVFGKGMKYRVLPVNNDTHDQLMKSISVTDGGDRIIPIANSTARGHITAIGAKAGLGHVASHDLRATFATDMYQRTKDILVVQQWLGHSSPETTRRYVEVKLDAMRAAL